MQLVCSDVWQSHDASKQSLSELGGVTGSRLLTVGPQEVSKTTGLEELFNDADQVVQIFAGAVVERKSDWYQGKMMTIPLDHVINIAHLRSTTPCISTSSACSGGPLRNRPSHNSVRSAAVRRCNQSAWMLLTRT